MTKKLWMTLGVIGIAVVLGFGMYQSNASHAEPTLSSEDIRDLVKAQYPGTLTALELTQGATGALYEVEMVHDDMEYELKIDGKTGEIINLKEKFVAAKDKTDPKETIDLNEQEKAQKATEQQEKEKAEKAKQQKEAEQQQAKRDEEQQNTEVKKKETAQKQNKKESKEKKSDHTGIDIQQAIDIALAQFPGVVEEVELDENNGRLIYEIEIKSGDEEAEFEIDAYTGEILVIEIDD